MTLAERCRSLCASVVSLGRRGTRRGAHEAQILRLQWAIDRHKAIIGKAIYPLLETGALRVDLPEVDRELREIRVLYERLAEAQEAARRTEADEPGEPGL